MIGSQRELPGAVEPGGVGEAELFSIAAHDGYLRDVSEAFAGLLGVTSGELSGLSILELAYPDDIPAIVAALAAMADGQPGIVVDGRFTKQNGHLAHLRWAARRVPGTDLWRVLGQDTTAVHHLLAEQLDLTARLELAVGQVSTAMWTLNLATDAFEWETQAAELLAVASEHLPRTPSELVVLAVAEDRVALSRALDRLHTDGVTEVGMRLGAGPAQRHLSLRGKVLDRDRRGRPLRAVGLAMDVTIQKTMEEQMFRMAMSDALTGVPNRRAFERTLRREWRRSVQALEPLSVAIIDIDNFKSVNDTLGHLVGDRVLCAVARSMTAALLRSGDVLARFGGEEFAVVLPGCAHDGAQQAAARILDAVRATTVRQADGWNFTVSIGTATWLPHADITTPADLLSHADTALYAAKQAGKNRTVAHHADNAA